MDLARAIYGCLLASFRGPVAPGWLLRRLGGGLGGVCLFGDNIVDDHQLVALTERLRRAGGAPVLATDEEGGDVTRLEMATGSSYPGNAALGAVDDVSLTEDVAASIGAELRAAGLTLALAPCVDVNSNAANPVIGVRSFGSQPELVASHGAAFVRGLHRAGVAACAKHFPGHGDTSADSHVELPVVDQSLAVLQRRELVPFRAVIEAGVDAVMTSHVLVPALAPEPATMSPTILRGLLRGELGFTGAIVSDALDMRGASGGRTVGDAAVAALAAGADLLCLGSRQDDEVLDHVTGTIARAVADRRLDEARLADAAERAAALGARPAGPQRQPDRGVGATAARRALRLAGEVARVHGAHVVELRPPPCIAAGAVPWGLGAALQRVDPTTTVSELGATDDPAVVTAAAESRALVVVVRDRHRHPWQAAHLDRLLATRPDAVVVDMGWPGPPAHITTFGASRASGEAVAALLTREDLSRG